MRKVTRQRLLQLAGGFTFCQVISNRQYPYPRSPTVWYLWCQTHLLCCAHQAMPLSPWIPDHLCPFARTQAPVDENTGPSTRLARLARLAWEWSQGQAGRPLVIQHSWQSSERRDRAPAGWRKDCCPYTQPSMRRWRLNRRRERRGEGGDTTNNHTPPCLSRPTDPTGELAR